jgi:hypothetical protein
VSFQPAPRLRPHEVLFALDAGGMGELYAINRPQLLKQAPK